MSNAGRRWTASAIAPRAPTIGVRSTTPVAIERSASRGDDADGSAPFLGEAHAPAQTFPRRRRPHGVRRDRPRPVRLRLPVVRGLHLPPPPPLPHHLLLPPLLQPPRHA